MSYFPIFSQKHERGGASFSDKWYYFIPTDKSTSTLYRRLSRGSVRARVPLACGLRASFFSSAALFTPRKPVEREMWKYDVEFSILFYLPLVDFAYTGDSGDQYRVCYCIAAQFTWKANARSVWSPYVGTIIYPVWLLPIWLHVWSLRACLCRDRAAYWFDAVRASMRMHERWIELTSDPSCQCVLQLHVYKPSTWIQNRHVCTPQIFTIVVLHKLMTDAQKLAIQVRLTSANNSPA